MGSGTTTDDGDRENFSNEPPATMPPLPSWGSLLQDKYVSARVVACCPTMDLIAILTADRQLVVHRTISWQRIVHVKPSEVLFTMETLVWSPDGMRLAVGCDEGELVVFSMATAGDDKGVEIKPHTSNQEALNHETAIVAMHWVSVRDNGKRGGGRQSPRTVHPSAALRNRSAVFTSRAVDGTAVARGGDDANVLVTADVDGRVGVWWNALVLVAMIPLQDHWRAVDEHDSKQHELKLIVHSVMLATDLSALFVDVSLRDPDNESSSMKRHVLRLDLRTSLQAVWRDLGAATRVGYEVHSTVERLTTSLRQMASEWKNATRVFELKMSLIGSLYEKYGCEEPPQVDMLAIVAGGIASPALAQYFAQDIQEMSIIRMQKMLMSGCDNIQQLLDTKIKNGLQQILFEVVELRGVVKWKCRVFSRTLGITTEDLDAVADNTRSLMVTMEELGKLLHETQQDFALFLKWLLGRVRIHTNDASSRPGSASAAASPANGMNESLLNIRRLVAFLDRAATAAKAFQEKKKNKFLVEVTFGNPVSRLLSSSSFSDSVKTLDRLWSDIMTRMLRSLSASVDPAGGFSLTLDDDVDEVHLHTRSIESPPPREDQDEELDVEDEDAAEDEEFDVVEAVDWSSLESVRNDQARAAREKTPWVVVAARSSRRITFLTCQEGAFDSIWSVASLGLDFLREDTTVHRMSLYGGINGGKRERLVVVATNADGCEGSLFLVDYDAKLLRGVSRDVMSHHVSTSPDLVTAISLDGSSDVKCRVLQGVSSPVNTSRHAIVAQASRGIVCVVAEGMRLVVLDAEEDPEDEAEEADSDDHDEGDL